MSKCTWDDCDGVVPDTSSATTPPARGEKGGRSKSRFVLCATYQSLSKLVVPHRVLRMDTPRRDVEMVRVEHFCVGDDLATAHRD
jgi:hypothetical protein